MGVTACIFFNDLLAISALRRFADRQVSVPGDMSVVGCDDIFGADFCNPPLTTITAPTEQVGRLATDMLLARLHQGDADHAPLPDRIKLAAPSRFATPSRPPVQSALRRRIGRFRASHSPFPTDETFTMYLGTQIRPRDDSDYRVWAQLGVTPCLRRSAGQSA